MGPADAALSRSTRAGTDEFLSRATDDAWKRYEGVGPVVVWCRNCGHQVEPDPAAMANRYGAETSVIDWHAPLVCYGCGSRHIDFVVSGTERR